MLKRNPTDKIITKTRDLIKKSNIPEDLHWKLFARASRTPTLYGLPKIHKVDIPLRPIVSAIGSPTYYLAKHLANKLQEHTGKTDSFVKDSYHFIELLESQTVTASDMLVSFDVESLFTNVPLEDTMTLIGELYPDDITALFRHCLTSSYFSYQERIYEQKEGVAMGSPLSPVVANFFMESFETTALDTAVLKPTCWFRYVDDTFVIWPHGREQLDTFLSHLNSLHKMIRFTMEIEENNFLAFLDVKVMRYRDGTLGHSVYRKPTHTNRYLNANSHHHPSQKQGLIKTLVKRAQRICEAKHLGPEMSLLSNALQCNGYSAATIQKATIPKTSAPPAEKMKGCAYLPYVQNTTDRIARVLRKSNIRTIFSTVSKISTGLRSVKDSFPLETDGIYKLECQGCPTSYVGQTSRNISKRMAEHERAYRFRRSADSAVAEHYVDTGHKFSFNPKVLARTKGKYARLVREAIEIHKLPDNINRDDGIRLKAAWLPILRTQQPPNDTRTNDPATDD